MKIEILYEKFSITHRVPSTSEESRLHSLVTSLEDDLLLSNGILVKKTGSMNASIFTILTKITSSVAKN